MATAKFSRSARPRGRAGGNHPRTHPIVPSRHGVPATTGQIIRRECRRLQKAVAVLTCLQTAAEYEVETDMADVGPVRVAGRQSRSPAPVGVPYERA